MPSTPSTAPRRGRPARRSATSRTCDLVALVGGPQPLPSADTPADDDLALDEHVVGVADAAVAAAAAAQYVAPGVLARIPQDVVAETAEQDVVLATAEQPVAARQAEDEVGLFGADQHVTVAGAHDDVRRRVRCGRRRCEGHGGAGGEQCRGDNADHGVSPFPWIALRAESAPALGVDTFLSPCPEGRRPSPVIVSEEFFAASP